MNNVGWQVTHTLCGPILPPVKMPVTGLIRRILPRNENIVDRLSNEKLIHPGEAMRIFSFEHIPAIQINHRLVCRKSSSILIRDLGLNIQAYQSYFVLAEKSLDFRKCFGASQR